MQQLHFRQIYWNTALIQLQRASPIQLKGWVGLGQVRGINSKENIKLINYVMMLEHFSSVTYLFAVTWSVLILGVDYLIESYKLFAKIRFQFRFSLEI